MRGDKSYLSGNRNALEMVMNPLKVHVCFLFRGLYRFVMASRLLQPSLCYGEQGLRSRRRTMTQPGDDRSNLTSDLRLLAYFVSQLLRKLPFQYQWAWPSESQTKV